MRGRIRADDRSEWLPAVIPASANTKRLPVVVLTPSMEDEDRIEDYRLCVNSYVRKPVEFTESQSG